MTPTAPNIAAAIRDAVLGMTLDEYAAAVGRHRQAVRDDYAAVMRQGCGLDLPAPTKLTTSDGVIKFCLPSGEFAGRPLESESVVIPMTSYRSTAWHTLCVSSQVGCRMGCTFCETGRMGLLRNLTPAEIVRQRLVAGTLLKGDANSPSAKKAPGSAGGSNVEPAPLASHPPAEPGALQEPPEDAHAARRALRQRKYFADGIQNIVFMGMGEPLDNLDAVVQAIRVFNEPAGVNFPHGQITVSTVGRIDGLRRLAALGWPNLRIAVSLNAATDELRNQLMPINKGMPLADLQRALLDYPLAKKGRFLVEYVLIKGVNDSAADADAVAAWCRPLPCIVNVIPYNPQSTAPYETPDEPTIGAFIFRLKDHGIFTKRRITHGRDLMGACGQLGNAELRRSRLRVLNGR